MKRNDFILLACVLCVTVLIFIGYGLYNRKPGESVCISVDGSITEVLPLQTNTTYKIMSKDKSINILQIKDGFASIIEANCPDKLCVHQKKISKQGETLICLPHKVIIFISSDTNPSNVPDGVAN